MVFADLSVRRIAALWIPSMAARPTPQRRRAVGGQHVDFDVWRPRKQEDQSCGHLEIRQKLRLVAGQSRGASREKPFGQSFKFVAFHGSPFEQRSRLFYCVIQL
jgi:hypothetical protein